MSNEEIQNILLQASKSQLIHLQQELITTNMHEVAYALRKIIDLTD